MVAIGFSAMASIVSAASSDPVARFDALDANGDGKLSRTEAAAHPELMQKFVQLDANKDGFLSRGEVTPKRRSFCGGSDAQEEAVKTASH